MGDVPFSAFTGRLFSLSTCKGKLAELTAARDCDELMQQGDGACLMTAFANSHNAKSSLPKTSTLPEGLTVATPPPSPLDDLSVGGNNNGSAPRARLLSAGNDSGPALYSRAHMPIVSPATSSSGSNNAWTSSSGTKLHLEKVRVGETVRAVPGYAKSPDANSNSATFVCGVCYTRGPAKPITLPCGHICHEGCYTEWAKRNAPATCPRCRLREKPKRKPLSLFGPRF